MQQSPLLPVEPSRRRWQFSIRGMLLFTASVAIVISVWQTNLACWSSYGLYFASEKEAIKSSWGGGLVAFFLFWIVAGLVYQIPDIRSYLAGHPHLDQEQKRGLRFEMVWRVLVILVFVLIALFAALVNQGILTLAERDCWEGNIYYGWGDSVFLREAILIFLLLATLGSVPHAPLQVNWHCRRWIMNIFAGTLAITICLIVWKEGTSYAFFLGHIGANDIDKSFPLKYSAINPLRYGQRCSFFHYWSILAGAIVISNGICLKNLAQQWPSGIARRCVWALLFLAGVASVSGYVFWIYDHGLKDISPYLAETGIHLPLHYWIAFGLLFIILITAMTCRLAVDRIPMPDAPPLSWRKNRSKYYHELRYFLFGLAIVIVAFRVYAGYELVKREPWILSFISNHYLSWPRLAELFLFRPMMDFLLAGLLIRTIVLAFSLRSDSSQLQMTLPRLNPWKFVAIWLATAVFSISGALALTWMSFGVWFNP